MNNKEKSIEIITREKEQYKKNIMGLLNDIENVWILQEIVRFIENIKK